MSKIKITDEYIDNYLLNNRPNIKRIGLSNGSHSKIMFCCDNGHKWKAAVHHILSTGTGCRKCYNERKTLTNEKIDNFLLIENKIRRIGNYIKSSIKIEWLCLVCNYKWKSSPNSIKSGHGCCKCANMLRHTNKSIDEYLLVNMLPIKRIGKVKNCHKNTKWKCLNCFKFWLATVHNIKKENGTGCPHCNKYVFNKNENIMIQYLIDNSIDHIRQFNVKIEANKRAYRVDAYLPKLNLFIEYNGAQHYIPSNFGSKKFDGKEMLIKQQIRDQKLREYCASNNINLLEIDGRTYCGKRLIPFLEKFFNRLTP